MDAFVLRPLPGMLIGESLMLVVGGLLAGIPLSLAAGYLLRTFLFGIGPTICWPWLAPPLFSSLSR